MFNKKKITMELPSHDDCESCNEMKENPLTIEEEPIGVWVVYTMTKVFNLDIQHLKIPMPLYLARIKENAEWYKGEVEKLGYDEVHVKFWKFGDEFGTE